MNNRTLRARVGAVLLVLALCLTVLPAAAASGSMQTVYLDSAEEFAAFAKSCSRYLVAGKNLHPARGYFAFRRGLYACSLLRRHV